MNPSDFDQSNPMSRVRQAVDEAHRKVKLVRSALESTVPVGGRIKLQAPYPFRWPDGRTIEFTDLVSDGGYVFLVYDGPERARIDLLSRDETEKIGAKTPGFEYPISVSSGELPDNVIEMPRRPRN